MYLTNLIEKLERIVEEHGDGPVAATVADSGGYDVEVSGGFGLFQDQGGNYILGGSGDEDACLIRIGGDLDLLAHETWVNRDITITLAHLNDWCESAQQSPNYNTYDILRTLLRGEYYFSIAILPKFLRKYCNEKWVQISPADSGDRFVIKTK